MSLLFSSSCFNKANESKNYNNKKYHLFMSKVLINSLQLFKHDLHKPPQEETKFDSW